MSHVGCGLFRHIRAAVAARPLLAKGREKWGTHYKRAPPAKKLLSRWKPNYRIYYLRHTFAGHCVSDGESLYVVGKLLGHSRAQTTQRYAHVDDAATRKTTENFAANIGW